MPTTVLVAEDEFLIAMDIVDELDAAGFSIIGPFAQASQALDYCRANTPDCAVLDVRLADGESFPIADLLADQGVPVVFHSGHATRAMLAARYPHTRVCQKPARPQQIADFVAELCPRADHSAV